MDLIVNIPKFKAQVKKITAPTIVKIIKNLYIGNWQMCIKRGSLNFKKITHILNVTKHDIKNLYKNV